MFGLFALYYDGDSNLSEGFCAYSENVDDLVAYVKAEPDSVCYLPDEDPLDDGWYGDKRSRYKINKLEHIKDYKGG